MEAEGAARGWLTEMRAAAGRRSPSRRRDNRDRLRGDRPWERPHRDPAAAADARSPPDRRRSPAGSPGNRHAGASTSTHVFFWAEARGATPSSVPASGSARSPGRPPLYADHRHRRTAGAPRRGRILRHHQHRLYGARRRPRAARRGHAAAGRPTTAPARSPNWRSGAGSTWPASSFLTLYSVSATQRPA